MLPRSDESQSQLRHLDGRVRIWCKHKSTDLSFFVSVAQAGGSGVMLLRIFFLIHFGFLSAIIASFKWHFLPEYCCWPYQSLYDPSSESCFQQDKALSQRAQTIANWFLEHDEFTVPPRASTVIGSQSRRAPLGCDGTSPMEFCLVFQILICLWWQFCLRMRFFWSW